MRGRILLHCCCDEDDEDDGGGGTGGGPTPNEASCVLCNSPTGLMPQTATLTMTGWTTQFCDQDEVAGGGTLPNGTFDYYRAIRNLLNGTHTLTKLPVNRTINGINSDQYGCLWATRYLLPNPNNNRSLTSIYEAFTIPPQTDVLEVVAGFRRGFPSGAHTDCVLGPAPGVTIPPTRILAGAIFRYDVQNPAIALSYSPGAFITYYSGYLTLPLRCPLPTPIQLHAMDGPPDLNNATKGIVDSLIGNFLSSFSCLEGDATQNPGCFTLPFPKNALTCQLSW